MELWTVLGASAGLAMLAYVMLTGGRSLPEVYRVGRSSRRGSGTPAALADLDQKLLERTRQKMALLSLRGLAPDSAHKLRLPLEELYIPTSTLDTRDPTPSSVAIEPATGLLTRQERKTFPLSRLLPDHERLLVVAPAGLGKTTFLRYVTLILSMSLLEKRPELVEGNLQIRWDGPTPIPLYLPLRELGYYLDRARADGSLLTDPEAIISCFAESLGGGDPAEVAGWARGRLQQGRCLVLFDGMDEVVDVGMRDLVDEAIDGFVALYGRNRYVVTSRPEVMSRSSYFASSFDEYNIELLGPEEITKFLENWYRAISRHGPKTVDAPEDEAAELMRAIRADPHVRDLARSPLILTVIAAMHYARYTLPSRRVELYDHCTLALCGEWDLAKPGVAAKTTSWYLAENQMTASTRRLQLEYVAEYLQDQTTADAPLSDLAENLAAQSPPFQSANGVQDAAAFLRATAARGGILESSRHDRYRFSHTIFQQYLCARRMTRRSDHRAELSRHATDVRWTETIRLAVAHLSTSDPERAQLLLQEITNSTKAGTVPVTILVGECLQDADRSALGAAVQQDICVRLAAVFTDANVAEADRFRAGLAFGHLSSHEDLDQQIAIGDGDFRIGSDRRPNERPRHDVQLAGYRLARYPVTNSQFARFITEGGYRRKRLWTDTGWAWRETNVVTQPAYWDDPQFRNPLQPVVGVSWFEALAYARWAGGRLPTEVEWEAALRSRDGLEWPWGKAFPAGYCNTAESRLDCPSPVGMYPLSRTADGLDDMLGNVWEWCSSQYRPYPYESHSSREDLEGESVRVLRGGSWYGSCEDIRPATRRWLHPGARQFSFGFRVAWTEERS